MVPPAGFVLDVMLSCDVTSGLRCNILTPACTVSCVHLWMTLRRCEEEVPLLKQPKHNGDTQSTVNVQRQTHAFVPAEIPAETDLERLAGMPTYVISGVEARWQRTRQVPYPLAVRGVSVGRLPRDRTFGFRAAVWLPRTEP